MQYQDYWLLPAGITEILPEEAALLEDLRRKLLDLYARWGYEMVIPPMIEYVESLLVGGGKALDLQTFRLTDQLTGRMMGVRADMTPQVARIDAHHLKRDVPTRLCYWGTVLHTRPNNFAGSRSPMQVGAELYGYKGVSSDIEVLALMLETLRVVGLTEFHLDVGHVEIYRSLVNQAQLDATQEIQLFDAIKRKAAVELAELLKTWRVETALATMLNSLIHLHGDNNVLTEARHQFKTAPTAVHHALDELEQLDAALDHTPLHFDLAELRGYSYHTGIVFAAYIDKHGEAIAKGGRYDDIGKIFGRARPATGFSTNLRNLVAFTPAPPKLLTRIFAPYSTSPNWMAKVQELRSQGEIVICGLPQQVGDAKMMECTRELHQTGNDWQIIDV
jgi:ATP phosphoribosyltransferase regulatory subunit